MNSFLKSQTIVIIITLCSITFISFWTLEKNSCFEMKLKDNEIKIGSICSK